MIISNSHKFIFVHIHKCAGTSVTHAFEPLIQWNDIDCGGSPYGQRLQNLMQPRFGLGKHTPACQIRSVVGEDIWRDYFTFTFVRNPFSRAVSLYTFAARSARHPEPQPSRNSASPAAAPPRSSWPIVQAYRATNSFSEFIRHKRFRQDPGSKPQFHYLCDEGRREIIVDYIAKMEELPAAFRHVSSQITSEQLALERRNPSSEGRHFREFYQSPDDIDFIRDMYMCDFQRLAYDSSLPPAAQCQSNP